MSLADDGFSRCVALWREADETQVDNGRFRFRPGGKISDTDPAHEDQDGWWLLEPPSLASAGVFVKDAQQLVERADTRYECPQRLYVVDDDYLHCPGSRDSSVSAVLARYLAVTDFIRLLKEMADHAYKDTRQSLQLVFLQDEKLLLPIQYQLSTIPDDLAPGAWREQLDSTSDLVARTTIFKKLLIDCLGAVSEPERFAVLLEHAGQIFRRFTDRYETYVAQMSAQTVLDDLAVKKLGWLSDIHRAISDLNAQALGVPIAILLGASRLTVDPAEVWVDWVIAGGLLVFALLLHRSVGLQSARLNTLKSALEAEQALLNQQYKSFKSDIEETFAALDAQVTKARTVLFTYQATGWGLAGAAVVFAAWVSCQPSGR